MIDFRIDKTDVILKDLEKEGQGQVIIADQWNGAYTFSWGSMGGNITEFMCEINSSYFADKLCANTYEFDAKLSVKNIRKYIRDEMGYELPFWKFMSAQKDLRIEINHLGGCSNADEFVIMCNSLPSRLAITDLDDDEEKEFKNIIESLFQTEPWNFIGEKLTKEYNFLFNLHGEIKKHLNGER